jgi:hypothetical protein
MDRQDLRDYERAHAKVAGVVMQCGVIERISGAAFQAVCRAVEVGLAYNYVVAFGGGRDVPEDAAAEDYLCTLSAHAEEDAWNVLSDHCGIPRDYTSSLLIHLQDEAEEAVATAGLVHEVTLMHWYTPRSAR